MSAWFWFIAGMMAGVAATLVVVPLWRGSITRIRRPPRQYAFVAVMLLVFGLSASLLYGLIGSPRALRSSQPPATAPHPARAQSSQGSKAEPIEAAVAQLEARLARTGGSSDEWLLLAQSYDFVGRKQDAERARAQASRSVPRSAAARTATSAPPTELSEADTAIVSALPPAAELPSGLSKSADQLKEQLKSNPRDAPSWLALANLYRKSHEYAKARTAYAEVAKLDALDAESWADYADVLGSLPGGSLGGEAGRAIDHALAADPRNAKALWLKASRAYQERRYSDSVRDWRALRAVLPQDSADARLVDANIAEANTLAAGTAAASPPPPASGSAGSEISGSVSIDDQLAPRVQSDATLFIYAKSVDSPGPPLAVMRTTVGRWPVSFRLDDSMAMLPSRRLSQFARVVIEARISRSGQATPAAGDLYVTSAVLGPGTGRKLALIINREIG